MRSLVMKFGGTSVGSAAAIAKTVDIVRDARAEWPAITVVVSAMSGVTDLLLRGAHSAAGGDPASYQTLAREIATRHETAIPDLLEADVDRQAVRHRVQPCLAEFESLCHAVNILGEASPRALDAISSLGERMSIHLVAGRLRAIGVPSEAIEATELILTDEVFGSATPDMEQTRARSQARLRPLLDAGIVPVVTGFIGATPQGVVATLGRGGSDYSAAILGAAVDADEVWIWTDVDGVMTADPRVVSTAQSLRELSFREVSELAYYGAKVLHPKTIRPVVERNIALRIKNTFAPQHGGTSIVSDRRATGGTVKAVTAIKGQSLITVAGRGMIGVPGVAARTFGAVARTGVSVPLISQASSEQSICFCVPAPFAASVKTKLEDEFRRELGRQDIDSIASLDDVVIVTVVGAGMRETPGIAGRVFGTLGQAGVNVIAIAQGSSECSISLIVSGAEADSAVRAIHTLVAETVAPSA